MNNRYLVKVCALLKTPDGQKVVHRAPGPFNDIEKYAANKSKPKQNKYSAKIDKSKGKRDSYVKSFIKNKENTPSK